MVDSVNYQYFQVQVQDSRAALERGLRFKLLLFDWVEGVEIVVT